ncbi:MAG: FAD-dependent oxidoreductase [Gammaproteobacteria bacterium]|nr:FAD-dependent oxidoreductase [Gammaproteobacteria bacterium]
MNPVIIIGTGLAGYGIARELRKNEYSDGLVLITVDDGQFYSKPMLSGALGKGHSVESLAMSSADRMTSELDATILTRKTVTAIDTKGHTITVDGETCSYSKLVLAIGASPIRLPFKGDGAGEVLTVNNLVDYAQFRERLADAKRVGIIGPGLIGSEFANDLLGAGYHVELIGPDKWPISTLLPVQAGRALQQSLSNAGAKWHLETFNGAIEKHGAGYRTQLQNGTTVDVDLFLSAVGVRPEVALAKEAGLEVNRGIVTDEHLLTSASDVYAVGDCAEVAGRNLPYVAPLMIAVKALGKTMTGTPTPVVYPHMPVIIKTTLHPIVTLPPSPGSVGKWSVAGGAEGVVGRFFSPEGTMSGFCLTGNRVSEKGAMIKEMPAA